MVAHVAAYSGRVRSAIASAGQIVNLAEARLKAAETITDVASKAANAAGGTATGFDLKPFDVSIRAAKDAIAGAEKAMPSPVADGEDPPPTWLTSIDEAIDAVGLAIKTRAGAMGTILDARTRINPARPPVVVSRWVRLLKFWTWWGRRPDRIPQVPAVLYEIDDIEADAARKAALRMDLVGRAFSGGGIRSATFNLGLLQGLAEKGLRTRAKIKSSTLLPPARPTCYALESCRMQPSSTGSASSIARWTPSWTSG